MKVLAYFARLSWGKRVLWCYLAWYVAMVAQYFDPSPELWLSSLGISAIIGFALVLSTANASRSHDSWTIFRLFLMPFCVSSYAALIKGNGFILIFSPRWPENAIAAGACGLLMIWCRACAVAIRRCPVPLQSPVVRARGSL